MIKDDVKHLNHNVKKLSSINWDQREVAAIISNGYDVRQKDQDQHE